MSEDEERWLTLGLDSGGALLVVHHAFTNVDKETCSVRIFSARKATKSETKQYKKKES
ncbi:MAG TPA: BrnT family toxin [Vicinamibacteria bacterium]|nr:BrnT family toxin [Vicinamibacteria bacterium]